MVTGPRGDGYYLGNDLTTVTQVWGAYRDLQEYIATNNLTDSTWFCNAGDKQEKDQQCRLRARRRLLWDAIAATADHEATVSALQALQDELHVGISRVEDWALQLKKKQQSPEANGLTILDIGAEYRAARGERHAPVRTAGV